MTLTVVTVTYNLIENNRLESFIKNLESVHRQTYESIEHLIIDGASTDGTIDILKEYSEKGWIKFISEPDAGIYDAMQKGARIAAGKYIYFLNSDDYFFNDGVVNEIIKNFKKKKADAIFGDLMPYCGDTLNKEFMDMNAGKRFRMDYFKDILCLYTTNIHHQTIFYKKEIFSKCSFFHPDFPYGSDWYFNIQAFLKYNYKAYYVPMVITCFGLGGVSTNKDPELIDFYKNLLRFIRREIKTYGNEKFIRYRKKRINRAKRRRIIHFKTSKNSILLKILNKSIIDIKITH